MRAKDIHNGKFHHPVQDVMRWTHSRGWCSLRVHQHLKALVRVLKWPVWETQFTGYKYPANSLARKPQLTSYTSHFLIIDWGLFLLGEPFEFSVIKCRHLWRFSAIVCSNSLSAPVSFSSTHEIPTTQCLTFSFLLLVSDSSVKRVCY